MTQIDFYILPQNSLIARLHFACRLAEKAFNNQHHIAIAVENQQQAGELSDYLWSFKPESFLPHGLQTDDDTAPIVILWDEDKEEYHDVMINLRSDIPQWFSRFERVMEIVIQEQQCLAETREHFQTYRSRGYPLKSHKIQGQA